MSRVDGASKTSRRRASRQLRLGISDETWVRFWAGALWLLVLAAAAGGLMGWVRSPGGSLPSTRGVSADAVEGGWAAAGFGARFVAAYLSAGPDDEDSLAQFLGYSPDLPATGSPGDGSGPVIVLGVDPVGDQYWAVTVGVGDGEHRAAWRVGVTGRGGELVAAGLPTPVTEPSGEERARLAMALSQVPELEEPVVQAVAGWVAAYVCGQGDLARYMAPGVELDPISPPRCTESRLDRWGGRSLGEGRRQVAVEAVLDPGPQARRVSFALLLARRDGRWEVAELLPAVPLADVEAEP